jgi:hypothetical protein
MSGPRLGIERLSIAALLVGVGCGRPALETHAAKPTDASTDDAPPTTSALCAVSTTQKPPFDVEFRFHSTDVANIWVYGFCHGLDYGVSSCASGYAEPLGPVDRSELCDCGVASCVLPTGQVCERQQGPVGLLDDAAIVQRWRAEAVQVDSSASPACARTRLLPAGKYRVSIRFYDNFEDASHGARGRITTKDFEVPPPNGFVDVTVGEPAPKDCDAGPGPRPVCTGREARATPCDLVHTVSYSYQGGELALSYDLTSVAPPNAFVTERKYYADADAPATPLRCAATIPRCSPDARIVTTSDVTRVLSEPSVAAAFTSPMIVFGDPTSDFGSRLVVSRSDGMSIAIASPCAAAASTCAHPLTPALTAVASVLGGLRNQRDAESCTGLGF